MNYNELNIIFKYLLNREPYRNEINILIKKSRGEVNQMILNSKEYKKFMRSNNILLKNKVYENFKIYNKSLNENEKIIFDLYVLYRNHNYNIDIIDKYLNEKMTTLQVLFKDIDNYYLSNEINKNLYFQELTLKYFDFQFNILELEFYFINNIKSYNILIKKIESII
jgi:hypothetical protein